MESGSFLQPVSELEQTGPLLVGPGAKRDATGAVNALPRLDPGKSLAVQQAKKYAMEQSIKMVLVKQTIAHQQHQAKWVQRHQAIILMCRIYIGSVNFEVKEDAIKQAFLPFGPVRSITMSWDPMTKRHKGFGFVEFEVPEAAQLALEQMNGVLFSGRNIKVGRPSNMPQAQEIIAEIQAEARNYNRIYISSIHSELTKDDIRSVFEAFGPIKTCDLPCGSIQGRHKGYCFIEYATEQAALDAISSMNLFDLGGQYLRVGRAVTPPDAIINGQAPPLLSVQSLPTASAVAAAAVTAKIQALDAVASNLGISANEIIGNKALMAAASFAENPSAAAASAAAAAAACSAKLGMGPSSNSFVPSGFVSLPQPFSQPMQQISQLTLGNQQNLKQIQQYQDLEKKLLASQDVTTIHQQENFSIKGKNERDMVMHKLMRRNLESVVIVLRNMVTPDEVDDDLQDEVTEECSKFGDVERVIIYQERQNDSEDADVIVKIFVEFRSASHAKRAQDGLNGRYFGGRVICAQIYDQQLYDHSDLSG